MGLGECAMKRWLMYHEPATGGARGWTPQEESTDLVIGSAVHTLFEMQLGKEVNPKLIDIVLPNGKTDVLLDMEAELAKPGALGPDLPIEHFEENYLYLSLAFLFKTYAIPSILKRYSVVGNEIEIPTVIDGITLNTRPDILLRDLVTGELSLHDYKTVKTLTDWNIGGWRTSLQMSMYALAVEREMKEPVKEYYIHAVAKGEKKPGTRRQTPLLYTALADKGGVLVPVAKGKGDHWDGLTPVWELPGTPLQKVMALDINPKSIYNVVGPYPVSAEIKNQLIHTVPAHERDWKSKQDFLDKVREEHPWTDPVYQGVLTSLVPRSYSCEQYNKRCPMWNLCMHEGQWKEFGGFSPRYPNHPEE